MFMGEDHQIQSFKRGDPRLDRLPVLVARGRIQTVSAGKAVDQYVTASAEEHSCIG
jgi:hypothetical protein